MSDIEMAPGFPDEGHRKRFEEAMVLLDSVGGTLAVLLARMRAGQADGRAVALPTVIAQQVELEAALRHAFETERRFHDWYAGQEAVAGRGADIDFDAARHDIGCRLSRLRECCAAE